MIFTDFHYSEEKAASPPAPQAPNSFCVPEGDEDPVEPAYETGHAKHKRMNTYNLEGSDIASESENQQPPEETSTPLTSPSTNGKPPMESRSEDDPQKHQNAYHTSEAAHDSQQSPIVLDREQFSVNASIDGSGPAQSDVSSNNNDSHFDYVHDQPFPYIDCDSEGDSLSVELDFCENDERLLGFDLNSESSQASVDESDEDIDSKGLLSKLPSLNYRPPYVEADDDVDDASILSVASDLKSATEKIKQEVARILRLPIVDKADRRRLEKAKSMLGLERLDSLAEGPVPGGSSTSSTDSMLEEIERMLNEYSAGVNNMAKPQHSAPQDPVLVPSEKFGEPAVSRSRQLQPLQRPSSFQSYPVMDSNPSDLSHIPVDGRSRVPYHDGPFTSTEPVVGNDGRRVCDDLPEIEPLGDHHRGNRLDGQERPRGLDQTSEHDTGHIRSSQGPEDDNNAVSKERVSIADIVNSLPAEDQVEKNGTLKRKADEMEMESLSEPVVAISPSDVSISQDAQPRASEGELQPLLSQLTEIQSIEEQERRAEEPSVVQPGHEDQPPRKRVKVGSFASHATTALVGAMVGGLGTIVALASLPPEYFH